MILHNPFFLKLNSYNDYSQYLQQIMYFKVEQKILTLLMLLTLYKNYLFYNKILFIYYIYNVIHPQHIFKSYRQVLLSWIFFNESIYKCICIDNASDRLSRLSVSNACTFRLALTPKCILAVWEQSYVQYKIIFALKNL